MKQSRIQSSNNDPKPAEPRYCPVILEPALEKVAALWSPARRRAEARKLKRWVRQLTVSAAVMERRLAEPAPTHLKFVHPTKLELN